MTKRDCNTKPTKKPRPHHTTQSFIQRAILKHGNKFSYDKAVYVNAKTDVEIYCNNCNQYFFQIPRAHIKGHGCNKCCKSAPMNQASFIKRAKEAHGNAFDYSKTVYVRSDDKVVVRCIEHDYTFEQFPLNHIRGHGCTRCQEDLASSRLSKPYGQFLKEARLVHGNRYTYRKDSYKRSHLKLDIHCDIHGWFSQSGSSHLAGQGCKQCGYDLSGYNRTSFKRLCEKNNNGNGLMYVIHCKEHGESFYKIGITSRTVKKRFISKGHLPYDFTELYVIEGEAAYIYDLENKIHALLKDHHYSPKIDFKGSVYECFTHITKPVEKLLKQLESTEQLQLLA